MNDEFARQLSAEMIEASGLALALVTAAIAKQLDPERLVEDLQAQLAAAEDRKVSALAIRQATYALAAVDAEILLRRQTPN
ncbi:MAG: hypothetical protein ABTR92_19800 [Candidatus Accumulibacter phosphatis]